MALKIGYGIHIMLGEIKEAPPDFRDKYYK